MRKRMLDLPRFLCVGAGYAHLQIITEPGFVTLLFLVKSRDLTVAAVEASDIDLPPLQAQLNQRRGRTREWMGGLIISLKECHATPRDRCKNSEVQMDR